MMVYPDKENYFSVSDDMMLTGTGISGKSILIMAEEPITGKRITTHSHEISNMIVYFIQPTSPIL